MPLLAHYKLNGDTNDVSGNGHHGSGDITYAVGKVGQYGVSDGTQYLDVGTLGNFGSGMANPISIAFWFKSSATPGALDRILGVINTSDSTMIAVNTRRAHIGDFDLHLRDRWGKRHWFYTTAGGWNDGVWHHVVLVAGTTFGDSRIYVDGDSKALTNGDFQSPFSPTNFEHPLYLFALNNRGSRVGSLSFSMDDLRLYDVALPTWKVKAICNFGKGSELCEPWQRLIRPTIQRVIQPLEAGGCRL